MKFDQLLYRLMESLSSQVVFQAMVLFLSAALSLGEVRFEFSFSLLSSPHSFTQAFFTVLLHKISAVMQNSFLSHLELYHTHQVQVTLNSVLITVAFSTALIQLIFLLL